MKLRSHLTKLTTALLCGLFAMAIVSPVVNALSGSDFQAGRIIDDAVFFNPNAMNPGDVQTFLNSKVPVCDTWGTKPISPGSSQTRAQWAAANGKPLPPYTCLKDFSQNIPTKTGDTYCGGTVTGGSKSAAQIIYDVSQACGVSPKILIILLQKEQSLVTDDWPWPIQYAAATGYGCPDTASCDPAYADFFSQVYYGARQFQRYVKQANLFNFVAGQNNFIQYNPDASCNGSNVFIQNQATAGLYNYTPYQPNQAALNNLYGTGDNCSAYGNRNFWRMYIDWFGSPNSNNPYGWSYEGQWAFSDANRTQAFTSVPTVVPGGKIYVRIKARNMGTQAWNNTTLHIGNSHPQDRTSQFADPTWLSSTRPAALLESSIASGQIGTFEFTLQAPNAPGTYNEYFNPLVEGTTWLNDLGLFFTINVNTAASPNNANKAILNSGESLSKNDFLLSPDGQTTVTVQGDGRLVENANFQPIWFTDVIGGNKLIMQGDGNLVLYDQNMVAKWASGTSGNNGARLALQTDGNMVIYSAGNSPLWATYTVSNPNHLAYVNTVLNAGKLYPGQSIDTADRRFHLVLQPDGNLVLYSPTHALWATGTDGKSIAFLAMQGDGNLVLYDRSGRPLWYSSTSGHGSGLHLVVQADGNLVLYGALGQVYWSTNTAGAQ